MNLTHHIVIRLENFCIAIVGLLIYAHFALDWLTFFYFILLPDLSIIAYVINNRIGALSYNLSHNYIIPSLLLILYVISNQPILLSIGLIWMIHIAFDRAMGFGLKYSHHFKATHLNLTPSDKTI